MKVEQKSGSFFNLEEVIDTEQQTEEILAVEGMLETKQAGLKSPFRQPIN